LKVLKLSAQGLPQSWISLEQAVLHYAADQVRWEVGAQVAVFRGGHNAATGEQSVIAVSSIIGTKGVPNINPFDLKPGLANSKLFARDRNICCAKCVMVGFISTPPRHLYEFIVCCLGAIDCTLSDNPRTAHQINQRGDFVCDYSNLLWFYSALPT
jgi:hypothetical protein